MCSFWEWDHTHRNYPLQSKMQLLSWTYGDHEVLQLEGFYQFYLVNVPDWSWYQGFFFIPGRYCYCVLFGSFHTSLVLVLGQRLILPGIRHLNYIPGII
jgi:hypothetical protein